MSNHISATPKAITKTIKATSRASVSIDKNYYTLEYTEERIIPDLPDIDLLVEKTLLWEEVNSQVDKQIEDVLKTFGK